MVTTGNGNTIYDGSGTDTVSGAGAGNNTFVLNAAGGTLAIDGFSLTNGDTIDLTSILSGVSASAITADPSAYLALTVVAQTHHSAAYDVLTVTGAGGTASVTLLNAGSVGVSTLLSDGVLKL